MNASYIPFRQLLHEEFTPFLLRRIPGVLKEAYAEAAAGAGRMNVPELVSESRADGQGLWVQTKLCQLVEVHCNSGIMYHMRSNRKKRSHLEIETQRALITAHRVLYPCAMPRKAEYRNLNASLNIPILPGLEEPYAPDQSRSYIFLLHGPDPNSPEELGFAQLAIPDSRQKEYLGVHTLFASDAWNPASTEEIQDTAIIKLKTQKTAENSD